MCVAVFLGESTTGGKFLVFVCVCCFSECVSMFFLVFGIFVFVIVFNKMRFVQFDTNMSFCFCFSWAEQLEERMI